MNDYTDKQSQEHLYTYADRDPAIRKSWRRAINIDDTTSLLGREIFFPVFTEMDMTKVLHLTPDSYYLIIGSHGNGIVFIEDDIGDELIINLNRVSQHIDYFPWFIVRQGMQGQGQGVKS